MNNTKQKPCHLRDRVFALAEDKRFAQFAVPESPFASRCSLGFFDRCTSSTLAVSSTGGARRTSSRRETRRSARNHLLSKSNSPYAVAYGLLLACSYKKDIFDKSRKQIRTFVKSIRSNFREDVSSIRLGYCVIRRRRIIIYTIKNNLIADMKKGCSFYGSSKMIFIFEISDPVFKRDLIYTISNHAV